MAEQWNLIRQLHPFSWSDNIIYFVIYLACLAVLFVCRKKEDWKEGYRAVFWYSIVVMILVCYNPIFTRLTFTTLFWYDMSVYVRVFLLLPVLFTAAYVVTGLLSKLPRIPGDLVFAGIVALIIVFGKTCWNQGMYVPAENPYKVNTQAVQICDMIEETLDPGERCLLVMPAKLDEVYGTEPVSWGIRQYDSNVILSTSFPTKVSEAEIESGEFETMLSDMEERREEPVYVACLRDNNVEEAMESYGYQKIGETEHFFVMHKEG